MQGGGAALVGGMGRMTGYERGAPSTGGAGRYQVAEFGGLAAALNRALATRDRTQIIAATRAVQGFLRHTGYVVTPDGYLGQDTINAANSFIKNSLTPSVVADYLNHPQTPVSERAGDVAFHEAMKEARAREQQNREFTGFGDTLQQAAENRAWMPAGPHGASPVLGMSPADREAFYARGRRSVNPLAIANTLLGDPYGAAMKRIHDPTYDVGANAAEKMWGADYRRMKAQQDALRAQGQDAQANQLFWDFSRHHNILGIVPWGPVVDLSAPGGFFSPRLVSALTTGKYAVKGARSAAAVYRAVRSMAASGVDVRQVEGKQWAVFDNGIEQARFKYPHQALRYGRKYAAKYASTPLRQGAVSALTRAVSHGARDAVQAQADALHVRQYAAAVKRGETAASLLRPSMTKELRAIPERRQFMQALTKVRANTLEVVRNTVRVADEAALTIWKRERLVNPEFTLRDAWRRIVVETEHVNRDVTAAEVTAAGPKGHFQATTEHGEQPEIANVAETPEQAPTEPHDFTAEANSLADGTYTKANGRTAELIAPEAYRDPEAINRLLTELRNRAIEASQFKGWYRNSAEAILAHVNGDLEQAKKLAALLAIYPPQNAVYNEGGWNSLTRALEAYRQYGEHGVISGDWLGKPGAALATQPWQTEAANAVMKGGADARRALGGGLKVNRFYRNFLQYLGEGVEHTEQFGDTLFSTHDLWMRRAFGYLRKMTVDRKTGLPKPGSESIPEGAYAFMEQATKAVADSLGWTPDEAQAAIWSSIKAQVEGRPLGQAAMDYSHALEHHTARLAHEATPTAETAVRLAQAGQTIPRELGPIQKVKGVMGFMLDNNLFHPDDVAAAREYMARATREIRESSAAPDTAQPQFQEQLLYGGPADTPQPELFGGESVPGGPGPRAYPFRSVLEDALKGLPERFSKQELLSRLERAGVKKVEQHELGIDLVQPRLLKPEFGGPREKSLRREDVLDWYDEHHFSIRENVRTLRGRGDDPGAFLPNEHPDSSVVRWDGDEYNLPGSHDVPYGEITLKIPEEELGFGYTNDMMGTHWPGQKNVVVHVRFSERVVKGKRTLVIEEIQSDWHQKAQQIARDYKKANNGAAHPTGGYLPGTVETHPEYAARGVPEGPFKDTESWMGLAVKRALTWAVDHDYEGLGWTTGETQAARNQFGNFFSRFEVHPRDSVGSEAYHREFELAWDHHANNIGDLGEHYDIAPYPESTDYPSQDAYEQALNEHWRSESAAWDEEKAAFEEQFQHEWEQGADPSYELRAWKHGNTNPDAPDITNYYDTHSDLEQEIDKSLADEVAKGQTTFEGHDLAVGMDPEAAAGIAHFYDTRLRSYAKKLLGRHGGKPEIGHVERLGPDRYPPGTTYHVTQSIDRPDGEPGQWDVWASRPDGTSVNVGTQESEAEAERLRSEWAGGGHAARSLRNRQLPGHGEAVHYVELTPGAKDFVRSGQPLYQVEGAARVRGVTWPLPEGNVIRFYQAADMSTGLHELAHAVYTTIPEEEKAILARAGIENHEDFATTWEDYFKLGRAPSAALQPAFDHLSVQLAQTYAKQGGVPGSKLNAQVSNAFDNFFMRRSLEDPTFARTAGHWWFAQAEGGGGPPPPPPPPPAFTPRGKAPVGVAERVARAEQAVAEAAQAPSEWGTADEAFAEWERQVQSGELGGGKPPEPPAPPPPPAPPAGRPLPEGEGFSGGPDAAREHLKSEFGEMEKLRAKQNEGYAEARRQKAVAMHVAMAKYHGHERYIKMMAAMSGELPKLDYHGLQVLDQPAIMTLFDDIVGHDGITVFAKARAQTALLDAVGGRVLQPNEIDLLKKIFTEGTGEALKEVGFWSKLIHQLWNMPRAIQSTFDLSAPFRQGLAMAPSHPILFAKSFAHMVRMYGSQRMYEATMQDIMERPNALNGRYEQGGVQFTDMGEGWGTKQREEYFPSSWAEQIPVAGIPIRASSRAFTGFINKMRADVFDAVVRGNDTFRFVGLPARGAEARGFADDPKFLKALGNYVNVATGRGRLGGLEPAASALNAVLFSPRLLASRVQLLATPIRPMMYTSASRGVRLEYLKSTLGLAGMISALLVPLSYIRGASVNLDPRNADFGKVRIGNTRFDLAGGFLQPIRLVAQVATRKIISSTTGRSMALTSGFGASTPASIIERFARSKLGPVPAGLWDIANLSTFEGKPVTAGNAWKTLGVAHLTPMIFQDMWDLYHSQGGTWTSPTKNGIMAAFGGYAVATVGEGVQTYGPKAPGASGLTRLEKQAKQAGEPPPSKAVQAAFTAAAEFTSASKATKGLGRRDEYLKIYEKYVGRPHDPMPTPRRKVDLDHQLRQIEHDTVFDAGHDKLDPGGLARLKHHITGWQRKQPVG